MIRYPTHKMRDRVHPPDPVKKTGVFVRDAVRLSQAVDS
jgi:hypothetical protein